MKLLPEIRQTVLENGMAVYVVERPEQPSVELECHVRTGSIHEGLDLGRGLSHFLEHMMFQGCRDYPGTAAADKLGSLGGDANAYTSFDHTVYHCELPARHWAAGLDVIAKMVRYPEFPEERFTAERDVILRECELSRDNPDRRLMDRLLFQTFQTHPMRLPIIGYPKKIAEVSRAIMTDYYRARYAPGRTFWLIVGAVRADDIFDALHALCGDWERGILAEPVIRDEAEQIAPRECDLEFDDPMARLALGFQLPGSAHPDIPALDIMCGLLGMSDASRLVRKLRQESELAVNIESFCYVQPFGGLLGIVGGTAPEKFVKLEKALLRELDKVRRDGFERREVEREKTQQFAEQLRLLRSNGGIANVISSGIYAADAPRLAESYMTRLEQISVDEVNAAATRYLAEPRISTVRQTPPGMRVAGVRSEAVAGVRDLPVESRLACGAKLVTQEDHALPLADCVLVLPGGALWEPAGQGGISRMLSDLMLAGCRRYTESEIADKLESLGATLSVSAGLNSLTLRANAPRRNFRKLVTLLGDVLHAPLFGERECAREKRNALDALESRLKQPRFAADRAAAELMFGAHPYSAGTTGTPESVKQLTAGEIRSFYRRICVPSQAVIGMGGDLSAKEAEEFGAMLADRIEWSREPIALPAAPVYPVEPVGKIISLEREQTVVEYCIPACDCLTPDNLVFNVLSDAMNGLSSTLFKRIREDHALAYSTGMRQTSGWQGGMLTFFAITSAETVDAALTLLKEEAARLGRDGLTEQEFREARDGAIFTLERMAADSGSHLYAAALSSFYGQGADQMAEDIAGLQAMTLDSANEVLRRRLGNAVGVTVIAGRVAESQ